MKKHMNTPASWRVGCIYPIGPRTEDPVRIDELLHVVKALSWNSVENTRSSLSEVFVGLSELVQYEIRYYYKRRCNSRRLAGLLKFFSWLFGSLGVLAPIVLPFFSGAEEVFVYPYYIKFLVDNTLSLGYLFFALAGSAIAADKIFSGSEGHQRYVDAQLKLEWLYTKFTMDWQFTLLKFDAEPSKAHAYECLECAKKFIESVHELLHSETKEWQEELEKVREELQNLSSNSKN